jgi:hypothetical protein
LGGIDRRRDRNNIEVRTGKIVRLIRVTQARLAEIAWFDLARTVLSQTQLVDAAAVDIEADDRRAGPRESDGNRQPDITEANNSDFALMCQRISPVLSGLVTRRCIVQ